MPHARRRGETLFAVNGFYRPLESAEKILGAEKGGREVDGIGEFVDCADLASTCRLFIHTTGTARRRLKGNTYCTSRLRQNASDAP